MRTSASLQLSPMRYFSGHEKFRQVRVNMASVPLILLVLIGICIPFSLCADTKVYDKNWNLKDRIDGDRIYDKNWNLKGRTKKK